MRKFFRKRLGGRPLGLWLLLITQIFVAIPKKNDPNLAIIFGIFVDENAIAWLGFVDQIIIPAFFLSDFTKKLELFYSGFIAWLLFNAANLLTTVVMIFYSNDFYNRLILSAGVKRESIEKIMNATNNPLVLIFFGVILAFVCSWKIYLLVINRDYFSENSQA